MAKSSVRFGPRLVSEADQRAQPRPPTRREPGLPLDRDELEKLDRELARLARGAGALRLRIGEALEVLTSRGWHHQLAFSSLAAYALERCGRTGRWASESCTVARRVAALPHLRAALANRELGWSMVELLARHATVENEQALIAEAKTSTVRRMRAALNEAATTAELDDDRCVLTLTVNREDAWILECTRFLFDRVQPYATVDEFIHWLVVEGLGTLREMVPSDVMNETDARIEKFQGEVAAWRAQREAWCQQAEQECEARIELTVSDEEFKRPDWELTSESYSHVVELDLHIRRLCRELADRDLLLGVLAERFWRADGWRRLGYAAERQYARERLGMSLASIKTKRALRRRSSRMPAVIQALEQGRIGFEAALLITRVATANTIDAWVVRAGERTVKMLREEVDAAELLIRMGAERDQMPPEEATLLELARAREATSRSLAASGQISVAPTARGTEEQAEPVNREAKEALATTAKRVLRELCEGRRRVRIPRSEACIGSDRGFGRVTLRFSLREETRDLWRGFVECFEQVRGFLPKGASPIALLCVSFYCVWAHELDPCAAYAHIYARDGFICKNPLCSRRDLTPHHLIFRSAGGGDEDENVVSLCVWCHLNGVHEGRIRAEPPASEIRWELGRPVTIVVQGRRKLAA